MLDAWCDAHPCYRPGISTSAAVAAAAPPPSAGGGTTAGASSDITVCGLLPINEKSPELNFRSFLSTAI